MSSRVPCIGKFDKFYYICGNIETETYCRTINDWIKCKYSECYHIPMKNKNENE